MKSHRGWVRRVEAWERRGDRWGGVKEKVWKIRQRGKIRMKTRRWGLGNKVNCPLWERSVSRSLGEASGSHRGRSGRWFDAQSPSFNCWSFFSPPFIRHSIELSYKVTQHCFPHGSFNSLRKIAQVARLVQLSVQTLRLFRLIREDSHRIEVWAVLCGKC